MKCEFCGGYTCTSTYVKKVGKSVPICDNCEDRFKQEEIAGKLENVQKTENFSSWSKKDLSEAFWLHLGIYKKCPNRRSLRIIEMAFHWACHDDHGLANSFNHAMKWCGLDLYTEFERTDLPATFEDESKGENKT